MPNEKIKILNHKKELKEYVKVMDRWDVFNGLNNLFANCFRQRWQVQLGKFIYDTYGENMPEQFKKLREIITEELAKSDTPNTITERGATHLMLLSICYEANYLKGEALIPVFGEPLLHSKFGEGFEEDDHQGHQHASYFLEIYDIKIHIGYDHRGSRVDIGQYQGRSTPAEIAFHMMMELIRVIYKNEKLENENTDKG